MRHKPVFCSYAVLIHSVERTTNPFRLQGSTEEEGIQGERRSWTSAILEIILCDGYEAEQNDGILKDGEAGEGTRVRQGN